MEKTNLLTLVVTLTVGIILAGSLLMPVLSDATQTEKTFTNDGYYRLTQIESDSNTVIEWDYTNPNVLTVNGAEVTINSDSAEYVYPYAIVTTDGWALRLAVSYSSIGLDLYTSQYNNVVWYVTTTEAVNATITLSNGTASFAKGENPAVSTSFTKAFIPDNEGDYVLKFSDKDVYLNGDSLIYSTGRSTLTLGESENLLIHMDGNIDDGVTATVLNPSDYVVSNIVIHKTVDSSYIDLYKFSNVTFDITDTDSNTATATYGQVIVPYKVTAELSQHFDPAEIALLNALPILIIVGLVMVGVGAIAVRNRD